MTQEIINIGSTANDKTGDPLRLAFEKINNNFTQLYSIAGGAGAAAGIDGSVQFRTTNNLNAVAYINNVWVAFGAPNKYFMSYDGTIWTNTSYPSSQQIRAVYASPFNLVAVGDNGTIITSTDSGVTWTAETSGTTENLYAVRYDAATDIFIAVGANGKILISPDSNSWVSQASGVTTDLLAIAYNQFGAGYVVVGKAGRVLISAAGTSWTTESSGVTTDLTGLTHDGVRYIATGASGVIIASTNGIVWFPRTSGTVQNLNAIVTANIANVATRVTVGANGVSFVSSDANAAIWTASSTGTAYTLANITYGNGYYYAVGLNGTIIDAANVANGWANISIPGSLDGSANFTFDPITGTLSVPNLDVANLYANVYTANTVVANQIVALEYANLGDVSNIYIGGGNANSVLQTDGNGVLSWVPGLEPGAPNLSVQFNVDGEFTGSANFTYNPTTQTVLSTKSNIGNAVISNLTVSTHAYLGDPANLTITGGANNFSLQTDGLGNLFWGSGPSPSIVSIPPVYFVSSPSPGTGQQFTDPVLDNYVSNADITLFVEGKLLEYQNYELNGNTVTIFTYLPPNANVDIIRQFVSEANVNYSNANVARYLPIYGGDILADVVTTTVTTASAMTTTTLDVFGAATMGNIFANGIFTDGYFYANGDPFDGGSNGYSNAKVAAYLASGNVTTDIITTANTIAGNLISTGDITGQNIYGNLPTTSANILYVATNGSDTNNGGITQPFLTIKAAMTLATTLGGNVSVHVAPGTYTEIMPITIPPNTALMGDNLRNVFIAPQTPSSDMFYMTAGTYVWGITVRNYTGKAFSYDPTTTTTAYVSPYIQNITSSTTTGTAVYIDGNAAVGTKAMIVGFFTIINRGGYGIRILNSGYSQLVNIYTIACDIGIKVESGGFCTLNGSDCSIGNYGLWAEGLGPLQTSGTTVGTSTNGVFVLSNMSNGQPHVNTILQVVGDPNYYTIDTIVPNTPGANTANSTAIIQQVYVDSLPAGSTVNFYTRSSIIASAHTFEYVGAGTNPATALPQYGGIPIEINEVTQANGGVVTFTSTDQKGNFKVGDGFTINQATGVITGSDFYQSLFAQMTPYILALGSD